MLRCQDESVLGFLVAFRHSGYYYNTVRMSILDVFNSSDDSSDYG